MELTPTVFPARFDLGDGSARELGQNPLPRLAVGRQFDSPGALRLLEPFGRKLDEPRAQQLRRLLRSRDGSPDQRNALFSLSKNPSSVL
jgi:hypothetical protein